MILGGFEYMEIEHTAEPIMADAYQAKRTICVSPLRETECRDVRELCCVSRKELLLCYLSVFAFTSYILKSSCHSEWRLPVKSCQIPVCRLTYLF